MIEYQNVTNELVFSTRDIPQNCGGMKEQIKVDNYNSAYKYFLELQCPNNKLYISKEIKFLDGVGTIELPDLLTQDVGKVFIQLVMRDETNDVVGKSLRARTPLYVVNKSINAHIDLAKESRTGDFIEFLVKNNENMLKTKEDLDNKVATGYFKGEKGDVGLKGEKGEPGKDGTIININGSPQQQVSFASDPQEQFDNKVNVKQLNNLSICPGNKVINGIFNDSEYEEFVAPANGYIRVNVTNFVGVPYVELKSTYLAAGMMNLGKYSGCLILPVTEKETIQFTKKNCNVVHSAFIYAKEAN